MKTTRQLAALEPMVLGRLRGISGDDWHAAPKGRWSLAQILHHLAVGFDEVTLKLEERRLTGGVEQHQDATFGMLWIHQIDHRPRVPCHVSTIVGHDAELAPGSTLVGATLHDYIDVSVIVGAVNPSLGEGQQIAVRCDDHRRDPVGIVAARASLEHRQLFQER